MQPARSDLLPSSVIEWRNNGSLVLTPKFQRRSVWKRPAKAYFIDSLIRGMPVPPIYIRETYGKDPMIPQREIIDGQQRLTSIIEFIEDQLRLSTPRGAAWSGKTFSTLAEEERRLFLEYRLNTETFVGISDASVLEIFSRLNTYSVRLNAQELRNGQWFGDFKQFCLRIALERYEYWKRHRIFSDSQIARMAEVEFTSDLAVTVMDGLQDKKEKISDFYRDYDEEFADAQKVENTINKCLDSIDDIAGDILAQTRFRRSPLFHTLACVVLIYMRAIRPDNVPIPQRKMSLKVRTAIRRVVQDLSAELASDTDDRSSNKHIANFFTYSQQQTDNIRPRKERIKSFLALCESE